MTKSYLFWAEKGNITVLSTKIYGQEFQMEFLKYLGEKTFAIPMDFWKWWKKAVSYTSDDKVDFCFVYDKDYSFITDEFLDKVDKPEETNWDLDMLKSFFKEFTSYELIQLKNECDEAIELSFSGRKTVNGKGIFFTNLCGIAEEYASTVEEQQDVVESSEDDMVGITQERDMLEQKLDKKEEKRRISKKTTDFARYFIDLLEAERD